jgi:hypothetical protein
VPGIGTVRCRYSASPVAGGQYRPLLLSSTARYRVAVEKAKGNTNEAVSKVRQLLFFIQKDRKK